MIDQTFKHKFISGLYCKITAFTNKGYKVQQYEIKSKKVKSISAYFSKLDFDHDKGLWTADELPQTILEQGN